MRSTLSFLVLSFLGNTPVFAQQSCASFEYEAKELRANPELRTRMQRIEAFSRNASAEPLSGVAGGSGKPLVTIPVVVHILYNSVDQNISDAQIFSQIRALNSDFRRQHADTALTPDVFKTIAADCGIQFVLATLDPQGRPTGGIIRKQTSIQYFGTDDRIKSSAIGGDDAWDADKYLNVWVGNTAGGIIGYSSVIGGAKEKDGIVIRYTAFGTVDKVSAPYNRGRTAVHEIGHWLGLRHIWGDVYCGDDYVDDTPPQRSSTFGCPTTTTITCDNGPNGNMYMNYMDLTYDACTNMFTIGQKEKMLSLFADGGPRHALLTSDGAAGAAIPEPSPLPDSAVSSLLLYPNPTQGMLILRSTDDLLGKEIGIYNHLGQRLMQLRITQLSTVINIGHLKEGVYFVRISNSNKAYKIVRTSASAFN